MATYSTLEEIKVDTQTNPSSNNLIVLRSEQRDAIDQAKEHSARETVEKVIINILFFLNPDSFSGMQRCVSVRQSVPCS